MFLSFFAAKHTTHKKKKMREKENKCLSVLDMSQTGCRREKKRVSSFSSKNARIGAN